jgi:hypothetical protein
MAFIGGVIGLVVTEQRTKAADCKRSRLIS